ncbi:hypothetical protein KUTeg_004587 [Tegillarca granosa]|uniref:Nucleolar protein 11 n=1 Tax=Tegillarca granosa TaxID=220873 RepID=A0ABQ9FTL6_TEGGR|nr:hypothetical protein KUTeg_004587 [Tegillarca granosa]
MLWYSLPSGKMAALGEAVHVCKLLNVSDLLSVDDSGLSGHIVVTQKTKSINLYKTDDQKIICSWSLKQSQNITSPTTWCESTKEFLTVINHKFKFDIHRVIAVGEWEPVVVCANGQVEFMSRIKENYKESETKFDILYCDGKSVKDSLCLISALYIQPNTLKVQSHWWKSDNLSWEQQSTQIVLPDKHVPVSCSCIVEGPEIKLYVHCSSESESSLHCTCHSYDSSVSGSTHQLQSIPGTDKGSSIVCIDSTHVGVAGILKNTKRGIGIYDTKFNTLQSWAALTDTKSNYKVFCHHGYIFTPCNKSLLAFPYTCQPSSLASIFQQRKQHESISVNEDSSQIVHHSWDKKKSNHNQTDDEMLKLFEKLCNRKETSSYKQFQTSFSSLIKHIKKNSNTHIHETCHMKSLVERCLTEERFWPKKELSELIQTKHFPMQCMPMFIDKLIVNKEVELLDMTLKMISEIPEACLCKILQLYLGSDSRIEKMDSDKIEDRVSPLNQDKADLINQVLITPYNDVFIIGCLRKLTFKDVLLLLEYLSYLLEDDYEHETEDPDSCVKPSLLQVVDWLCVLIDAHITQLIISPDARIILLKLHSVVESLVEFYDDLRTLDALLQQLKVKSAISQKPKVGQYCIEVLHVH